MQKEDAEEYTQSLGQIVAGSWRQISLAKRLGVPKALGLTTEQWVNERLGGYVRMSIGERREAVKNLTVNGHSLRETAEILGTSHQTIANDVNNLTPVDAVAALAADNKIRSEIARVAKEAERKAAREGEQYDDGCTVEDLNTLIAAGKKFAVIYADPPWAFKVYSGKGKQRSADRHYDTASIDDIKALPVGNLAASVCQGMGYGHFWLIVSGDGFSPKVMQKVQNKIIANNESRNGKKAHGRLVSDPLLFRAIQSLVEKGKAL